jgi:drug/metabolite transporter superfamily protein YnfA
MLNFWTHIERLNCIVGTQTCRSNFVINRLSYGIGEHWLRPGNTTRYLCRTNMAASCGCYVVLSLSRTTPVESDHHHRVAYFLHALQARFSRHDQRATIASVAHVAWTYPVPRLSSHNCACCACYGGLFVAVALMATHTLTPDTLELVLAWNVVDYSSP